MNVKTIYSTTPESEALLLGRARQAYKQVRHTYNKLPSPSTLRMVPSVASQMSSISSQPYGALAAKIAEQLGCVDLKGRQICIVA